MRLKTYGHRPPAHRWLGFWIAEASQAELRIVGASTPSFGDRDEIPCLSGFLAVVVDGAGVLELTLKLYPQHQSCGLEQYLACRGSGRS